ncbi:methyl-accepting chemotaxis protein [Propionispora vibrioides]|uniref:Methyl-accepting chemotaxis protein n=1 Tax=Propionispora vibrioides TaxID=112903 RepID=A0A1H8XA70_9FIRM|nr:methyl-accepting chemotaxis protein [Propionispora vibrioides]SEP36653.1 methyl-accepting chemotaxis protein [Propionispora vibrioides]
MNVRNKLILIFSLLAAAILLVSTGAGYFFTKDQLTKEIYTALDNVSKAQVHKLDGWLISKAKILEYMDVTIQKTVGDNAQPAHMSGYKLVDKEISDMYIGTAGGVMIDGSGSSLPADYDPRKRPWYKQALTENKLVFTDPYLDMTTNQMAVSVAKPVKGETGQVKAVIAEDILLQTLVDTVKQINLDGQGYAYLLDSKGFMLAHPDPNVVSKNILEDSQFKTLADLTKDAIGKNDVFKSYQENGKSMLAVFNTVPTTNWTLVICVPEDFIYQPLTTLRWLFIGIAFLSILIVIGVTYFIAKQITQPLESLAGNFKALSEGDLTVQAVVKGEDEFAVLAKGFNYMINNLHNIIRQLRANAETVASSSEQLTASAEQSAQASSHIAESSMKLAEGSEKQISSIDAATTSINEMAAGIQHIAANTQSVTAASEATANAAQSGGKTVEAAVQQMDVISRTVMESAEVVSKLGERSKEITQIVDTISSIAGQTNLLALNAAIEAARAGEQGRGFAVVADEVRKLAEQSQDSAKQIAELITEIQRETDRAVQVMQDGTREVKNGSKAVDTAGQSFTEITGLISQVSAQITDMSAAIQQIAAGSQEVVTAVNRIDEIGNQSVEEIANVSAAAEQQSASMEEIASSSSHLAKLAQELDQLIHKFKV